MGDWWGVLWEIVSAVSQDLQWRRELERWFVVRSSVMPRGLSRLNLLLLANLAVKSLRFSLRALLIATAVVAGLLGWRIAHVRETEQVARLIESIDGSYKPGRDEKLWPGIKALTPIRMESVGLRIERHPPSKVALAVRRLARLNCVERLELYAYVEPVDVDWRLLAECATVRRVDIDWAVGSADEIAGLAHFPRLEGFYSNGSTGGISDDAFRFLHTLPRLTTIGSPSGEFDVPEDLRGTRPGRKYERTDFPP